MHGNKESNRAVSFEQLPALRQVEAAGRIDIDEQRHAARAKNGERGSEGRERRRQDFIARAQAEGSQPNLERVEAVAGSNRMRDSPEFRQFRFERFDLASENVPAACTDATDSVENGSFHEVPLAFEIVLLDRRAGSAHARMYPATSDGLSILAFAVGNWPDLCSMHGAQ